MNSSYLNNLFFFGKKNNIDLNAATKERLSAVAAIHKKHPQSGIVMKGHTCYLGTDAVNEKRSLERATVCADYLISQGVDKTQS